MSSFTRWCPNVACSRKRVVCNPRSVDDKRKWECLECKKRFSAKQVGYVRKDTSYHPSKCYEEVVNLLRMNMIDFNTEKGFIKKKNRKVY